MNIKIKKQDGSLEDFNADRINKSILRAAEGLTEAQQKSSQIATETQLTLYDGMTTTEIDQAVINAALQNVKDDPEFDIIAARLLLKIIYKEVLGDYVDKNDLETKHKLAFKRYIEQSIKDKMLSPSLSIFNLIVVTPLPRFA
jgi:ribonucleoside-diphosphate reductase alpha chain